MGFFSKLRKLFSFKYSGLQKQWDNKKGEDLTLDNTWKGIRYKAELNASRGIFSFTPTLKFLDIKFPLVNRYIDQEFCWVLHAYFGRILDIYQFQDLDFVQVEDRFYLNSPIPYPKKLKNKEYLAYINLTDHTLGEEISSDNPHYELINALARKFIDGYLDIKINIEEFYKSISKIDITNRKEVNKCVLKLRQDIKAYNA